jgi:hypothetical protein
MPRETGEEEVRSSPTMQDGGFSTSITSDLQVPGSSFEFRTVNAGAIFDYLTKAFALDYMTKKFARYDSGWRSFG